MAQTATFPEELKTALDTINTHTQVADDEKNLLGYFITQEQRRAMLSLNLVERKADGDSYVLRLTEEAKRTLAQTRRVRLSEQLKCAQRELALRERVYPKWVAANKMKQEDADKEIAAMRAITNTLSALADFAKRLAGGAS